MNLPLMSTPLSILFIAAAAACQSSTPSHAVSAISLSPDPCAMTRTNSVQMKALATLPNGTKEEIGMSPGAAWKSGNSHTAAVSATGMVVGVNTGVTGITVAYEGATGNLDCTVVP